MNGPDRKILNFPWRAAGALFFFFAAIIGFASGVSVSERPEIAGVFLRRLDQGWRLQTDPTVIYGIKNYDGNIRKKDLTEPHPWNTYVISGMPPTPISSPGRDAMVAVLQPKEGKTMYFVAKMDGSGGHDFSVTYDEHKRKIRKYLLR